MQVFSDSVNFIKEFQDRNTQSNIELRDSRLKVCKSVGPFGSSCTHFTKNNYCTNCGCNMEVKAAMPSKHCPIGLW